MAQAERSFVDRSQFHFPVRDDAIHTINVPFIRPEQPKKIEMVEFNRSSIGGYNDFDQLVIQNVQQAVRLQVADGQELFEEATNNELLTRSVLPIGDVIVNNKGHYEVRPWDAENADIKIKKIVEKAFPIKSPNASAMREEAYNLIDKVRRVPDEKNHGATRINNRKIGKHSMYTMHEGPVHALYAVAETNTGTGDKQKIVVGLSVGNRDTIISLTDPRKTIGAPFSPNT